MSDNADNQQPVASATPPEMTLADIKKMTVEDFTENLLKRILRDYGVTLDQIKDFDNAEKRPGYGMRVVSKDSTPMPSHEDHADLMAARASSNAHNFFLGGAHGVEEILKGIEAQKALRLERGVVERTEREYALIIHKAPWYAMWVAKTLLFFKNLFKRSN